MAPARPLWHGRVGWPLARPTFAPTAGPPMNCGRLIRVTKGRGEHPSVAYIVAQDSDAALALIKNRVGVGEIEDMGRVSDALLHYLHLHPGETRILERS